ncbi:MAG TPA: protein kinase, partial [Micromonosporaceae bacterium]|nr:protein kinase [Micromonosporaceae bacterium]
PVEARDVGVKIADALADAHALGVLHRDVKPANILITRFGEPALADFGLAILAETRDSSVTLDVLTPAYAPPELFRHSSPAPANDVYALCATLYAVIRGRPARWREDRDPTLVTLMDLFDEPVPDLPGVPPALVGILRAGMSNDPGVRPTAERLRDLLAAVPLPPDGQPSGSVRPPVPPTPAEPPTVPTHRPPWTMFRRGPRRGGSAQ